MSQFSGGGSLLNNENSELIDILKTYAAGDTGSPTADMACASIKMTSFMAKVQSDFKLGSYLEASAGYLLYARDVAQCAVGPRRAESLVQIPLPMAFDQAGTTLAMTVIASKAAGIVLPETAIHAKNAVALLSANKTVNAAIIKKVKDTGLVIGP